MAEQTSTQVIASRVKELRQRKGWSPRELGEHLAARTGETVRWDRFTVGNLENGKRQNVTVQELLALARVLDVAPVHLLVPVDEVSVQISAVEARPASLVRAWVRGEYALPGTDERTYRAEVPLSELSSRSA